MAQLFSGWRKLIIVFIFFSYSCFSNAQLDGGISIEIDDISAKEAVKILHSFSQIHDLKADQYVIGKWDSDDQKKCKENNEEKFCFAEFYLVHVNKEKCNPSYLVEKRCSNNGRDCELVFHESRSKLCD